MVQGAGRILLGRLCLELDRQLAHLNLDADDVVADEVSVIAFGEILEMLAHGGRDENLDLGKPELAFDNVRCTSLSLDTRLSGPWKEAYIECAF
jgi:hypothetical protein